MPPPNDRRSLATVVPEKSAGSIGLASLTTRIVVDSGSTMNQSPLRIIFFVTFVDLVGYGLIIPLQASYAERMNASGFVFGMLIGVYAVMQLIFSPLLGRWSDRVGRRRVLMISLAGSVVSHALLGVADLAVSLPLLFVARTFDGITGANIATAQAYIADVTTPENRARGMGLFGAAFGLGFVIGPALGAGLVFVGRYVSGPRYGTAWPAFGASVIALIAFLLVWRFLPEPPRHESDDESRFFSLARLVGALSHPRLRELFVLMFTVTFAFVLLEVSFVYLCKHSFGVAEAGTGLLFAYIGVIMVIVQGGMIGHLVRRFGEMRLLSVAPFITALGLWMISGVPQAADRTSAWLWLILGCIPTAVGSGLTGPNLNALISRQASMGRQGTTLGLSQGIGSFARALGPPLGGFLYDRSHALPFQTGAAILVVAGVFALSIARVQRAAMETQRE